MLSVREDTARFVMEEAEAAKLQNEQAQEGAKKRDNSLMSRQLMHRRELKLCRQASQI
jgi:hypothetical protein